MTGTLRVENPEQEVYKAEGPILWVPVKFKDIVEEDTIKLDLTDKSIYIVESDYYNDGIEVQQVN